MISFGSRWPAGRRAVPFVLAATLAAAATAHVRLRYAGNGALLFWADPTNISFVINSDGSDDLADGSHATAIRSGFEAWNDVGSTRARLVEDTSPGARSRRDWQSNDVHLVMFDENDASGFFPGFTGIVAITPIEFSNSGEIRDADILFNGGTFSFTTSGAAGHFDVQNLAAHEAGHLLGLDHSGVCGATMYPFVNQGIVLHRSLSIDDVRGIRDAYPDRSYARIEGRLLRPDGVTPLRGGHVVARDTSGRVAGATLTGGQGEYALTALDAGVYTVYVDPLDRPVSEANLGGGQLIDTAFESKVLGSIGAPTGLTASLGTHEVGPDVDARLGRVDDNYPIRIVRGESRTVIIGGVSLVPGSVLTLSDPTIAVTSVLWFGGAVRFVATVPAGAPLGHVDAIVQTPTDGMDVLVGGLEVTPPTPSVATVTPAAGDADGGTSVTISGQGFRGGARVVIGDRIYRDGQPGGCSVLDPTTITLTTGGTIAGDHDVVVIDSSGLEGRAADAFEIAAAPIVLTLFPAVGAAAGGTPVLLTGEDFVAGTTVTIDGVLQADIEVESPTRLRFVTAPGVVGGPHVLTVQSPSGATADAAFRYVAKPDPVVTSVTPRFGDVSGGTRVTVNGVGFTPETRVNLGASAGSGAGGQAVSTQFLDANTLRITTPSSDVGVKNVVVSDVVTGQGFVLESGYTYTGGPDDGGGDGGGCAAVLPGGPPSWRGVVGGSGWSVVLFGLLALRALRRGGRPRFAPPVPAAATATPSA
ncbi:MAG: IPT/TIG domain-containing protein [Planctomycetota bacterium]